MTSRTRALTVLRDLPSVRRLLSSEIPELRQPLGLQGNCGDTRRVYDIPKHAPSYLQHVFRGVENFPDISIYVHGSWADDTRTPFSDLDDLVVVHRSQPRSTDAVRRLEKWLNRVDLRFLRLDPLQHHGHWILHEDQLSHLDESYMPLVVLDGALRVHGRPRIEAFVDTTATRRGLARNFRDTIGAVRGWTSQYMEGQIRVYHTKHLIGAISLLPAYTMQLRGAYVTKREAIARVRDELSPRARAAIDWATRARDVWGVMGTSQSYWIHRLAARVAQNPHLHRRIIPYVSPRLQLDLLPGLDPVAVDAYLTESARMARL